MLLRGHKCVKNGECMSNIRTIASQCHNLLKLNNFLIWINLIKENCLEILLLHYGFI